MSEESSIEYSPGLAGVPAARVKDRMQVLEDRRAEITAILETTEEAPVLFHPKSYTALELPLIVSRIQTFALLIAMVTVFLALKTLPPKPARYKRHRNIFMVLQWVYLPLTTIVFNSFAALYSQTRLMTGRYMSKFDVTDKAVVSEATGSKRL